MAPKKTKPTHENLHSDSPSMDASQEANTKFFSDLIRNHQKRTVERKARKRDEILTRHNNRMGEVKSNIAQRIEKNNGDVKALRRPKVQRLMELARKKRELEDKINSSKAELEHAYLSVANALQIALEGRVNELPAQ